MLCFPTWSGCSSVRICISDVASSRISGPEAPAPAIEIRSPGNLHKLRRAFERQCNNTTLYQWEDERELPKTVFAHSVKELEFWYDRKKDVRSIQSLKNAKTERKSE